MHMADALITPLVGGAMYVIAAKLGNDSIREVRKQLDDTRIPLMGVMGAFVFAAQMINFTIPGTGSSGHLGGGMLLAAILGPHGGFLAMAAILIIQALFFADGGLLALGCNIINMGFYTCFIAYPLIYKRILKKGYTASGITAAAVLASVVGLQLGSLSVVVQTMLSNRIEIPFKVFLILMQSIHLAIGTVEGLITAAVISFVWKARPELIEGANISKASDEGISTKRILLVLVIVTLLIGGILSWYASENPDGLEWSLYNSEVQNQSEQNSGLYQKVAELQNKLSVLPDYSFREGSGISGEVGTSIAGIVGSGVLLILAAGAGIIIKALKKKSEGNNTY